MIGECETNCSSDTLEVGGCTFPRARFCVFRDDPTPSLLSWSLSLPACETKNKLAYYTLSSRSQQCYLVNSKNNWHILQHYLKTGFPSPQVLRVMTYQVVSTFLKWISASISEKWTVTHILRAGSHTCMRVRDANKNLDKAKLLLSTFSQILKLCEHFMKLIWPKEFSG